MRGGLLTRQSSFLKLKDSRNRIATLRERPRLAMTKYKYFKSFKKDFWFRQFLKKSAIPAQAEIHLLKL
ncbi:MAG TPA: hypothetical protein VEC36_00630 [Patescibacteria group bacterium]|nr:hypothetical protein [Patescibacteria group bacterium]